MTVTQQSDAEGVTGGRRGRRSAAGWLLMLLGVLTAALGAYLLFGLAAAATWILKQGDTLDFVRSLATAWGGLFLAIAHAFFRTSTRCSYAAFHAYLFLRHSGSAQPRVRDRQRIHWS